MAALLPTSFYIRDDVLQVSQDLLGKVLVSQIDGQITKGIIVETEAYRAPEDRASHAYGNKRTPRTETIFQKGGCAYVYLCYGIHQLFNVVTGPAGTAHVALVRAIQPTDGLQIMSLRRGGIASDQVSLCNGPGKCTEAMAISKVHDGISLLNQSSQVRIEDAVPVHSSAIISGPRVGIKTAAESSNLPWRFRIAANRWTSKPDQVYYDEWPL